MEDCIVDGIPFKKGMCVLANQLDLHMDPDLWGDHGDPGVYEPERYGLCSMLVILNILKSRH